MCVRRMHRSNRQNQDTFQRSVLLAMVAGLAPMGNRICTQARMRLVSCGTRNCVSSGRYSMGRAENTSWPRRKRRGGKRRGVWSRFRNDISNQVWEAYSNMKTALRQQQAAAALLTSTEQSYEAAHESYGYGVRNLLDVVSAQKALAQARSEDILARTQLLLQVANLAFRTGDLTMAQPAKTGP